MSGQAAIRTGTEFIPPVKCVANPMDLVPAAVDIVQQGLNLLADLNDQSYSRVHVGPFHASIGQHYRHIIEHFQCLIRGLPRKEVEYDARERDIRLETELSYATASSCQLLVDLNSLTVETLEQACTLIASPGYRSRDSIHLQSTGTRELAYCVEHAVHHYAIVRFISYDIGVSVPKTFGYAPSTLKHLSSTAKD